MSVTGLNPTLAKRTNTEAHTQSTSAVDSGRLQLLLSPSILSSGHHFHGLGDFLDVLDGLQPNGDWKQAQHNEWDEVNAMYMTKLSFIYQEKVYFESFSTKKIHPSG